MKVFLLHALVIQDGLVLIINWNILLQTIISGMLSLKAPITTAADNKFFNVFPKFKKKLGMIFHENLLPADDSHEISCLIYF